MIGKTIIELDRVDSTNSYANSINRESDLAEGTVIWAFEQFAGRGQQDNRWESEPGKNLTFSVILYPEFLEGEKQFRLNKAISLGIVDFLESLMQGLAIKWPNDIYAGNRKIGGLLIENKIMGKRIKMTIAGIGININQANYSPEIPNPVSLIQVLRREMALKEALTAVCQYMDTRYLQLKNSDYEKIDQDYERYLLGVDEWRLFEKKGVRFEGKIEGVDDYGRLLIMTREGERLSFNHREIEYILS